MGTFGLFSVLFGALCGWLFWGEALRWSTVTGSPLRLLAGLTATWRGRPPTIPGT